VNNNIRTVPREILELKLVVTKSLKALKATSGKARSCVPCIDIAVTEGSRQSQTAIDQIIGDKVPKIAVANTNIGDKAYDTAEANCKK
jgi:hypothetical protein